jgi:hypothetical protein
MDVTSTTVAVLRRQGLSYRLALQRAGASYLDVRRALWDAEQDRAPAPLGEDDDDVDDDDRRVRRELCDEVNAFGGLDRWWSS